MLFQVNYKRLFYNSFTWSFLVIILLSMACGQGVLAATDYTWYRYQTGSATGGSHSATHFHVTVNANTSMYWDWYGFTGDNTWGITMPDQTDSAITVTCGGNPLITGSLTFSCTGGACPGYANLNQMNITFDNKAPEFSYSGTCDVTGFTGTASEYYTQQGPVERVEPSTSVSMAIYGFNPDATGEFRGKHYLKAADGPLVVAPVINNVTSFPTCLEPGTGVVLESNVTGTVDDWTWEIYDQSNTSVFTGNSPIEQMVDLYVLTPGDYNVQLTVENTEGSDFWEQDDFLHINQSGTCNFTIYEPFPTVTVSPTIQVYPTLTLPVITDTNMTGINTEIDELWIIGNMSEGYREMVDYYGEGVNTTFTGLVGIIVSPFTFIANAVSTGSTLFSSSISSLMSYTTIPLAIVGITLGFYPWQIITLITAGIAVDAIFVLIFGVR